MVLITWPFYYKWSYSIDQRSHKWGAKHCRTTTWLVSWVWWTGWIILLFDEYKIRPSWSKYFKNIRKAKKNFIMWINKLLNIKE